MEIELPPNWKGLTLDRYDGSTDSDEHIDIYVTQLGLYTMDDNIFCKVFPTSLKEATLSLFTRLPPKSIDSFGTLVTKFGAHFATSRPHHLTSIALVNIQQEKGESLRNSWIDSGLNPEVAMHHMVTTL